MHKSLTETQRELLSQGKRAHDTVLDQINRETGRDYKTVQEVYQRTKQPRRTPLGSYTLFALMVIGFLAGLTILATTAYADHPWLESLWRLR